MKKVLNELQRILKEQTYTMYDGHYDWDEQPTDNISF